MMVMMVKVVVFVVVVMMMMTPRGIPPNSPLTMLVLGGLPAAVPPTPDPTPDVALVLVPVGAGKLMVKGAMPPSYNRVCGMAEGVRGLFVPHPGLVFEGPVAAGALTKPK